jgi:hypothetical protein
MMSASPKADLIFEYVRDEDGSYYGLMVVPAPLTEGGLVATAQSHEGRFTHEAWVRFVVAQIQRHPREPVVVFKLRGAEGTTEHRLDPRTVEQIRVQSLSAEDLIL